MGRLGRGVHRHGTAIPGEKFDAILVCFDMTDPHEAWLGTLGSHGRLVLPLTCTMDQMSSIGKDVILLVSNTDDGDALVVRVVTMVAIYWTVGIRDATVNDRLGKAFMRGPRHMEPDFRADRQEPRRNRSTDAFGPDQV